MCRPAPWTLQAACWVCIADRDYIGSTVYLELRQGFATSASAGRQWSVVERMSGWMRQRRGVFVDLGGL